MITEKQRQQMLAQLEEMSKTASKLSEAVGTFAEADKLGISYDPKTTQHEDLARQIAQTKGANVTTSQTGDEYTLPPIPALPTMDMTDVSNENVLAMALKNIAQLAQREGKVTGLAATSQFFADRGILPEDLPGSSVANMLAVVDRAMTSPVAERAGSIADLLEATVKSKQQLKETATMQMDFMIQTGQWNTLLDQSPDMAKELWEGAGFAGAPYKVPTSTIDWELRTVDGNLYRVDAATGAQELLIDGSKENPNRMLSVAEAKALEVPYGTTVQQAIDAHITPKSAESEILSQSMLNKLGIAGVDQETALTFQSWFNEGLGGRDILEYAKTELGFSENELVALGRQLDAFIDIGGQHGLILRTEIKRADEFERLAKTLK